MNLRHLTDNALLADTKKLAHKEREISLQMLHHFKEIEKRRLFADLGYSSLFDYAVRDLGYSNGAASRRISAARLLKEMPFIEKKIISGDLNLTNLVMAGGMFKKENIIDPTVKKEILLKIEKASTRECEKTLLEFQTTPSLPPEQI